MPALLHGGGDLPRGMKMDLRSGSKSSLSQVASSVANNLNRSADIVDQRTAELPAVISEVHRLLTFANHHLPDMRVALQIAQNGVIAFAFIALAAIISTAVTAAVKATDKTTTTADERVVVDDRHRKIADVTTAVLYSLSVIVFFGIVIHSSLKWKHRKQTPTI